MGIGRNVIVWSIADLAESLPIQFSSIPIGILLGGLLADYVFEPFMLKENAVTLCLRMLVGEGAESGMAVMFLCTGLLGALFSFIFYQREDIRKL